MQWDVLDFTLGNSNGSKRRSFQRTTQSFVNSLEQEIAQKEFKIKQLSGDKPITLSEALLTKGRVCCKSWNALRFPRSFKLYGQANKRTWWMPRQLEAMKDVVVCDKLGEGDKQPLYPEISEWGNPPLRGITCWIHRYVKLTRRTESSKYPEEKKSIEIPLVAASERGPASNLYSFR